MDIWLESVLHRYDGVGISYPGNQNPEKNRTHVTAKGSVGFSLGEGNHMGKETPEGNFTSSKRNVISSHSKQYLHENFTRSKNMIFSLSKAGRRRAGNEQG